MARGPSIISAACRLIVDHGPDAAEEAERRKNSSLMAQERRLAMLWDQVAIAIRTIEQESAEPGLGLEYPMAGIAKYAVPLPHAEVA